MRAFWRPKLFLKINCSSWNKLEFLTLEYLTMAKKKYTGKDLAKARERHGLTQEQLGERIGRSRSHVNVIENSDEELPAIYVFVTDCLNKSEVKK